MPGACAGGDTHTRSAIRSLRFGVTEGAGLAVVSLAQSRKCAGDKAAMWQDVMDF